MSNQAVNTFEDLTGVSTSSFSNPYDALIAACEDDPVRCFCILYSHLLSTFCRRESREKYELHRTTRNQQQKAKMLDANFQGVNIDPILLRVHDTAVEPGYKDPRNCFVFWGRPTQQVKDMINRVQQELLTVAPNLWLMPRDNLHITALEITHSKTAPEIQKLVDGVQDKIPAITDFTHDHRTRLIKPLIGYDASAIALSFVPAASEGLHSGRTPEDDKFTYHHLRRDLFSMCRDAGLQVESRYVVPSSHLTIGRFIHTKDFEDGTGSPDAQKTKALIDKIEEINAWLEKSIGPNTTKARYLLVESSTWDKKQVCTAGQAFLEAPLGQHHATTVTDGHRNSNHHKGLRADKTQEWAATMTDNHKPMVLHHLVGQRMPARGPPGGGGGAGPARQLRPIKSPGGNAYAFGNIVAVSPQDFPPNPDGSDVYILINGNFALSARPTQGCNPGEIGLTDAQRTWASISLGPQEVVMAAPYDHFAQSGGKSYLGAVDVEVGFAGRKTTETPYDQDELATMLKKSFENQILAPGQQLLMDIKSIPLRLSIRTVTLADLSMEKDDTNAPSLTDPRARGILTRHTQVDFFKDARTDIKLKASARRAAANSIIQPGFKFEDMGIGGLDKEFGAIFRRAFASRILPPGIRERMGIDHVRGMLLYGPPGTGKTLIARQIGKMLNAREPKVINGPEVLNKYVGASEENIRKMFADAEKEQKEKGDESGLHIIIFDELDAVCKQRGSGAGSGTGVGDSVVNQLLSKLDGVDQLHNILLIGMTNRMDMIDEALLRPGRLEVHLEISLPDESGRAQILKIHTAKMRKNDVLAPDVDVEELAKLTKNFSGAEINGLVRAATSYASNRHIKDGTTVKADVEDIKVMRQDFMTALDDVKPLFGVAEEELSKRLRHGIIHYSSFINDILEDGRLYINQVRKPESSPLLSVALHGPPGSGKTALAAKMAIDSGYPFIKLISAEDMIGYSEMQKVGQLDKVFRDAYKSPLSVIVIDSIELLLDWVRIGPRFSNTVLAALKVLLGKEPPKDRRLLIFATTTERSVLTQLDLFARFDAEIAVPNVNTQKELANVLQESGAFSDSDQQRAISEIQEMTGNTEIGVGIKKILTGIETAKQDQDVPGRFARVMSRAIAANRGSI
ncbi:unnamed protein product [Alternaria alternata]